MLCKVVELARRFHLLYSTTEAVLDYKTGERPGEQDLLNKLCEILGQAGMGCLRLYAKWGAASIQAAELLAQHKSHIGAVICLQKFIVGGGEGREVVNQHLQQIDVPVLKGIRLTDRSEGQWLTKL